jgi:NADH-quinone oxidoreductase subunit H
MLLLTIIIASLTLIERKFLALVQRRVGPQFVGYKGRLQYIADALKLFIKGIVIPSESNKFWFITIPSIVAAVCYSFWINAVWGPSISLFEVEFNIIYISLFSVMFGICVMLTGFFSKNKYAMLAAVRTGIGMLNLEIFLGLMLLNIVFVGESFSFLPLVVLQEINWLVGYFFIIIGLITITFLLETNRAPFDLAEAESELVAGYQTEYGGFLFGLYYLGEYMHLFFFSLAVSIMFLGGWELPMFVFNFFLSYYDNDFLNIFKVLEN